MVNPWIVVAVIVVLLIIAKPMTALASKIVTTRETPVELASRTYKIPSRRIYAMIAVESANNEKALGSAGERGLMQMKPGALSDVNNRFKLNITFDELWQPEKAIQAGAAYLRILCDYFSGNLDLATQAYNRGMGKVALDKTEGLSYLAKVKKAESTFS